MGAVDSRTTHCLISEPYTPGVCCWPPGEPVKVVSERLGHASATITLTVHQHVHLGTVWQAADRFAALLDG